MLCHSKHGPKDEQAVASIQKAKEPALILGSFQDVATKKKGPPSPLLRSQDVAGVLSVALSVPCVLLGCGLAAALCAAVVAALGYGALRFLRRQAREFEAVRRRDAQDMGRGGLGWGGGGDGGWGVLFVFHASKMWGWSEGRVATGSGSSSFLRTNLCQSDARSTSKLKGRLRQMIYLGLSPTTTGKPETGDAPLLGFISPTSQQVNSRRNRGVR